jgi:hypothetical protein
MLPLLVAAVPGFLPLWEAFLIEWKNEPEPPPLYLALSDLAHHLAAQMSRGDTAHFPAVFAVVERCHTHGDAYVREAMTIGLLEGLQNRNLHTTTAPAEFEVWLGPKSKAAWESLNRFWSGEAPLVQGDEPET